MKRHPLVFIVIVNYNGQKTLPGCLRSIFRLEYPLFRVVVVDNASTDGSLEVAKKRYPNAHYIRNSDNVGFARGANVGIRFALDQRAEYVWLVNPDALVSEDSLQMLIELMERNARVGMASPLILSPTRRAVWFGGGRIAWFRFRAIHTTLRSKTIPFETGFLSGCALLVKSPVFRIVGLFDERFFLYYEDADLSVRSKRAGFPIVVHPQATVTHSEESRNNPEKLYWLVRSGLLFFSKNIPVWGRPYFILITFLRTLFVILRIAIRKDDTDLRSVRDALRDFRTYGY